MKTYHLRPTIIFHYVAENEREEVDSIKKEFFLIFYFNLNGS